MYKEKYIYIFILIAVAILTHLQWINPFSVLSFGDWSYWSNSATKGLWHTWGTWYPFIDFGNSNIQISFLFFKSIWGLIELLGGSFELATRVTFLIPIIILSVVSPYCYAIYISNNKLIAFTSTLFYTSTTFFILRQTGHLPIALVYGLVPLIILYFHKLFTINKPKEWIIFSTLFTIGTYYELRIMYIVSIILVIIYITLHIKDTTLKITRRFLLFVIFFLLLSAFWLLPTVLGKLTNDISAVANRGLFGNQLFSMPQALTIFESSWTDGYPNMNFEPQPIPWRFWIIPILVVLGILTSLKKSKKILNTAVCFSIIALLGILLTKQSGLPERNLYEWLYTFFPGFNLFREASKFYLLTSVGYFGLLLCLLINIKHRKIVYSIIVFLVIILSLLNMRPMVTGEIRTLFVNRTIPSDYIKLSTFIGSQRDSFKTLWIPTYSRWVGFSAIHPKISAVSFLEKYSNTLFINLNDKISDKRRDLQLKDLMQGNLFPLLLRASTIKYIGIPLQDIKNDDNFYKYFGEKENPNIHEWYIENLKEIPYLKSTLTKFGDLIIYQNLDYRQTVSSVNKLTSFPTFRFVEEHLNFISKTFSIDSDFVVSTNRENFPTFRTVDTFENILPNDMTPGQIVSEIATASNTRLYFPFKSKVNIDSKNNKIQFNAIEPTEEFTYISLPSDKKYTVEYNDKNYSYVNLIKNPSFEDGLWQPEVGDCNNADDDGLLAMSNTEATSSDGAYSLELSATRHIACISQNDIRVNGGKDYLLQFDYQSPNSLTAGYYLGFDNGDPFTKRISIEDTAWKAYRRIIKIPNSATKAYIYTYAYEDTIKKTEQVVRYDNFYLIELPDVVNRIYAVDMPQKIENPESITFDLINPTKKLVHIAGATTPFYLTMSEAYHPQWQAQLNNDKVVGFFKSWIPWVSPDKIQDDYHFKLDGFLNGWYVAPAELCGAVSSSQFPVSSDTDTVGKLKDGCKLNADGSYDIEMIIEFTPQRYFYVGLLISGTTLLSCLGYLGYDFIRRRKLFKSQRLKV